MPAARISLIFLLLISSLSPALARANNNGSDVEAICAQLIADRSEIRSAVPGFFSALRLFFDPGSFIAPLQLTKVAAGDVPARIRIFTLGHLSPVSSADHEALEKLQSAEKKELQTVLALLKSKSPADCVARAKKMRWDPSQLLSLENLEQSELPAIRDRESELSFQSARRATEHRNDLTWEIVPVDSWSEILQSLRTDPVSGAILMLHADSEGRLYDSLRDELPTGFFNALPPEVRFIGIFSCDSQEVAQSYSLGQLKGEVVGVHLTGPFAIAATTPLSLFPNWLGDLDVGVPRALDSASEQECSVSLTGIESGRVSVSIRGQSVGVWSGSTGSLLFPCAWIGDPASLSIFIEPSQLGEPVVLSASRLSAEISGPSKIALSPQEVFKTDSGNFRSAILVP